MIIVDRIIAVILGSILCGIFYIGLLSIGINSNWAILLALSGMVVYPTCKRSLSSDLNKIVIDIRKLLNSITETIKGIIYLIVFITIVGFLGWGLWRIMVNVADFITPTQWTLMVCDTKMGNGVECMSNSYVIPGFKSKKDCMLEGAGNFSHEGFECGSDCKEDHGMKICKEICNKSGCTK